MNYNYAYNEEGWGLVRVPTDNPNHLEGYGFTNKVLSEESALAIVRALNSGETTFAEVIDADLVDAVNYGTAYSPRPFDLKECGFLN